MCEILRFLRSRALLSHHHPIEVQSHFAVDRSADAVEHLLPESLLLELEERLAREGRLPSIATEVPASPHELSAEGNSS